MMKTPEQEAALERCRALQEEKSSYSQRRTDAILAARSVDPPVRWRELAAVFEMTEKGVQKAAGYYSS